MRIGFIGCGKMGGSILSKIKGKLFKVEDISVFELNNEIVERLTSDGIEVTSSVESLCEKVDVILLAIKPQDFSSLLSLKNAKNSHSRKNISQIPILLQSAALSIKPTARLTSTPFLKRNTAGMASIPSSAANSGF